MCGIAGLFRGRRGTLEVQQMTEVVHRMISTMPHRGPDAQGMWSDPAGRCVLGHLRLSIIDTSNAGLQPRESGDGRWLISFNGELYNFQELRPALAAAGITLQGRTDTEVLIESIALWGADALPKFDGMFAFAAFDTLSGELFLARDAFGEKPLYYMQLEDGLFAFASELQALEKVPGFNGTVSIDAMAEMLTFQYIGAPRSIYQHVKKLPPGHWLRLSGKGEITTGRYFEFRPGESATDDRPIGQLADELEEILATSLRRRLIADVPLGAFLSGGVDSSTVCALVRRKLNLPLKSYSIGFEGAPETEHIIARAFAQHLGTEHHEQILNPNASEFLLGCGALLDEPNGDSSCLPTYLLSRFAREQVTVAVSGDGGDEMFGGYGRYFHTLDERNRRAAGELPDWRAGDTYFGSRILVASEPEIIELFGFVPRGFEDHLQRLRAELNDAPDDRLLAAMRRSDTDNYMPGAVLPKVDRMSMRHSLEVRTPFLNAELARFAERLPEAFLVQGNRGKILLREVAYRYLPRDLIDLPKQGFGMPMSDWARTSLLDVASKLIASDDSRLRAALGSDAIDRFMKRQAAPGGFVAYQTWALATLESWLRHHPAIIPSLAEPRARYKPAKPATDEQKLDVVEIRPEIYLVGKGVAEIDERPDIEAVVQQTIVAISLRDAVTDPALLRSVSDGAGHRRMELPGWNRSLTGQDIQQLAPLRGATLLFYERDASFNFSHTQMLQFRRLGVARIFYRSPFIDREFHEIDFRYPSKVRRVIDLIYLFLHRTALLSNNRWLSLLGRARAFAASSEGYHQSETIRAITALPDVELSGSFMMFEGIRQLPPAHVTHNAISTSGDGRYSIWNQSAFFSPTEPARLNSRPYWIVPITPATEQRLLFAPRIFQAPVIDLKLAERLLQSLLSSIQQNEGGEPFSLQPGDRVVVCTHSLPPGGAERQWVYLAQALTEAGYLTTFVTYESLDDSNAHYLPVLQASGITVMDAAKMPIEEAIRYWPRTLSAAALLDSGVIPEPDRLMLLTACFVLAAPKVVFSQLDHPNLLAGAAAHFARVPRVVMSFRNYNPTNFPYLTNDWFLAAYRLLSTSDRVLFSGNFRGANDDYADWIGIPHDRVAHIPNAIEQDMFPMPDDDQVASVRAELGLTANTPVILGVFRLSAEKAPLIFLEVCTRIIADLPEARAFIVGMGPLQSQLEGVIAERGLQSRVVLLGRRSDVNALMRAASVFLLTSEKEGMPNVLMEAQLMATPIVATKAGGTSEAVIDGRTATLCHVGDVQALTDASLTLLRDPDHARRMGDEGRRFVLTAFPRKRLAESYVKLARGDLRPAPARSGSTSHYTKADLGFIRNPDQITRSAIAQYVAGTSSHPLYAWMNEIKKSSMLHVDVLLLLRALALATKGGVLEIGSYIGGSTIAIASGVRDRKTNGASFVSLEPGGRYLEHPEYPSTDILRDLRDNLKSANVAQHVTAIEGHSSDPQVREKVFGTLGGSGLSLLFIDADGEVGRDMELYRPLLKPGCFVVFDDYHAVTETVPLHKEVRVKSVVDEEVRNGRLEPLGVFGWGTWFGRYRN